MAGVNPILPPVTADEVQYDPFVVNQKIDTIQAEVAAIEPSTTINQELGETFITPYLPNNKWLAPAIYNSTATNNNIVFNINGRGKIFFILFVLHDQTPIDTIAINATVARASGVVRLGIYNEKNGRPDTLIVDGGSVSIATTGNKLLTLSPQVTLEPGRYWIAINPQDTVDSTGAIQGGTVLGVIAHKYHDGVGSALGGGPATNPMFFTAANSYTSGGLPASTSDGSILFVDTGSTALSYYVRCAIRAGTR